LRIAESRVKLEQLLEDSNALLFELGSD